MALQLWGQFDMCSLAFYLQTLSFSFGPLRNSHFTQEEVETLRRGSGTEQQVNLTSRANPGPAYPPAFLWLGVESGSPSWASPEVFGETDRSSILGSFPQCPQHWGWTRWKPGAGNPVQVSLMGGRGPSI